MRALALAVLICAAPAAAQIAEPAIELGDSRWLGGGDLAAQLYARPREVLRSEQTGGRASLQVELGRLAFRSPQTLGGTARREELACESCHARGHVNEGFFAHGLSSRPGTVDVTHALFNPWREDGLFDPIAIPSLRGAAERATYGAEARLASLREFIRRVVVEEFAGDEPPPWLLDALTAYVSELMPTDAPDRPAGLSEDLDDIDRFLDVLDLALDEGAADKVDFVVGAVRFQLGRIHQRFQTPGGEAARRVLVGWSRQLADTHDRAGLAALRERIAAERPALEAAEAGSLYELGILRRTLGGGP